MVELIIVKIGRGATPITLQRHLTLINRSIAVTLRRLRTFASNDIVISAYGHARVCTVIRRALFIPTRLGISSTGLSSSNDSSDNGPDGVTLGGAISSTTIDTRVVGVGA